MKIALVTPYDFSYPGGVTEHVKNLAREFIALGHEVHVLAPGSREPAHVPDGVSLHPFGRAVPIPANGSVARIELSLRTHWKVRRLLREELYDVIHLHEPLMPVLPLSVLRHSTAVNIGTFHAFRRSNFAYFYTKLVAQPFFNRLHGLIAVSTAARDFVAEYFPGDYRIIPNGVHYERFAQPRPPLTQFADGRLNVLFVGRLEKRKGLKYLLRAWERIRTAVPLSRLIVVGEGRPRRGYQRYVKRRGWDEVRFEGFVSDDDLPRYFQAADVFCAPSTGQESFGIVLLEAMAAGRAIVASNIPGYVDVVNDGLEGLLVRPKRDRELAEAVVRLLRDEELRRAMGETGRRRALEYRWDRVAAQVLDFYAEVSARRPSDLEEQPTRFRRVRRAAHEVVNLLAP